LFARADKTELPLITMDESGVCAGIHYYDAEGNKKTGTRDCSGGTAVPADVMRKGDYDKNADGTVDKATISDSAAVSGTSMSVTGAVPEAAFALGKEGTAPTYDGATKSLGIVGNGTFYKASLGGLKDIARMSVLPAGSRVTVFFEEPIILRHSDGAFKFGFEGEDQLLDEKTTVEFLSLGTAGWLTTHVYGRGAGFEASLDVSDTQIGFNNFTGPNNSGQVTVNWDAYDIHQNTAMQYVAADDEFIALLPGLYEVDWSVSFAFSGSGSFDCALLVYKGGAAVPSQSSPSASGTGFCRSSGQMTFELDAEESITIKALLGSTTYSASGITLNSTANGKTSIRIRRAR